MSLFTLIFQQQVGSHYEYHEILKDTQDQLLILILFELSSVYFNRFNFSISFSVIRLNPPAGKYWLIAQPLTLLASRYMIYFKALFLLHFFMYLLFAFPYRFPIYEILPPIPFSVN